MPHVDPIFSYPIMLSTNEFNLDDQKLKYILELERKQNFSNFISKNKYVLNDEMLIELKDWILNHLNMYFKDLMKYVDAEIYITQSWINYTNFKQSHHRHNHGNSLISGVFYFDEGNTPIVFTDPINKFPLKINKSESNLFNDSQISYNTRKNQLMLFPSLLDHEVGVQDTEKIRMSLSFNTWVKGIIGRDEHSNKLIVGDAT
jgi:uncharacterized protein (TIGR02466 family)|tara:strand:+ start:93 stop:701 length:609 start_codon:yes stop_codon:yes gene_type:complete